MEMASGPPGDFNFIEKYLDFFEGTEPQIGRAHV